MDVTAKRIALSASISFAALGTGCTPIDEVIARQDAARQELVQETAQSLKAERPCCATYQLMKFAPLAAGKKQDVILTSNSPIFDFPFGLTRFSAFELPALGSGDTLMIGAIEIISGPTAKAIFRPRLMLLDEEFHPLDPSPVLTLEDHFYGWSTSGHRETIALGMAYPRAKYVIVAADPSYYGKSYVQHARSWLMPAGGNIYLPMSAPQRVFPYGYEGPALIEFDRARP